MVLSPNAAEVTSPQKNAQFKKHKPHPLSDQNDKVDTLLPAKTAKKPYPLGPHIPIYSI